MKTIIPHVIWYLSDKIMQLDVQLIGTPNVQELVIEILKQCIVNPHFKLESINKTFAILQKILVDNNYHRDCAQETFIEAKKAASHILIRILQENNGRFRTMTQQIVHVFYDQLMKEIAPSADTPNNSNKLLGLLHFLLNLGLKNMTKIVCPILDNLSRHI